MAPKAQTKAATRTWVQTLEVVGMGFRKGMTKERRVALGEMAGKRSITGCTLVREPDNPKDPNAIQVFLPERVMDGMCIGYLHREVAEVLAPHFDSGRTTVKSAKLESVDNAHRPNTTAILYVRFADKR